MQPGAQAAVQERPSVSFQDDGDADGGNVADHGGGGDDGAGTIFLQNYLCSEPSARLCRDVSPGRIANRFPLSR